MNTEYEGAGEAETGDVMGTLTVGSLFSGIGGFDLGLERAGMKVEWSCEKDTDARAVLADRWPDVPCYDDVSRIHGRSACPNNIRLAGVRGERHLMAGEGPVVDCPQTGPGGDAAIEQDAGRLLAAGEHRTERGTGCDRCVPDVDVLCGGFPCQDLSVAGRRKGLAGERSGLFHEFMRLAGEFAPGWVLVENVPGLLSSNDGRDMGVVLGVLADLGYGWAYRVLDAQYFGVAQRRRRVFIVGCAGGRADRAAAVLFESESCGGDSPPSREAGQRVAASLTAGTSSGSGVNPPGRRQEDDINIVAALTSHGTCGADDNQGQAGHLIPTLAPTLEAGANRTGGTRPPGTTVDTAETLIPTLARCLTTSNERIDGESETFIPFHVTQDPISGDVFPAMGTGNSQGCGTYNPYRTLEKDGTITSGFAARPVVDALHGPTGNKEPLFVAEMGVRRLLPVECERLQGFPDNWTAGRSDSARYRMLGNAVCVPVAEWIGGRITRVHLGGAFCQS